MIHDELSKSVCIVGTDLSGKGGIAAVLKSYSTIFPSFNYVCSHKFTNKVHQLLIAVQAIFKVIYFCCIKKVKIVHIHTASYNAFFRDSIYLLIAKLFRRKVVLHLHGGKFEQFYNQNSRYCSYICHKADCIVGVSNYFKAIFDKYKLNDNIKVVYNSVDKPLYLKKTTSRTQLNLLFLGSIVENKGIYDILSCVIKYRSYFEGKVFLRIGGSGQDVKLNRIIQDNRLSNIVEYLGWVELKKKHALLAETDIYLQPSYFESLGIAIIEAMSYKIPIIASRTGGIPELVTNLENGILISPGAIDDMYSAIKMLIENRALREDMGDKSGVKAENFTIESMSKAINDLYQEILVLRDK